MPFVISVLIVLLMLFSVSSCASTREDTATPHADTPIPAHVWQAESVLIEFGPRPGNPAPFWTVSRMDVPQLILYADGTLILNNKEGLQQSHLTQQDMCALLNSIERSGFFDVDLSAYKQSLSGVLMGETTPTIIKVNAWRSRSESLDDLPYLLNDSKVSTPPAIREVYNLLNTYAPQNLTPYQSNRLAIAIHKISANFLPENIQAWPIDSLPLHQLYAQGELKTQDNSASVLEMETAREVAKVIDAGRAFTDDGTAYGVSARPLLPNESLHSALGARDFSFGITMQLTCSPADGFVETR
jgi:hypothetical protein